MDLLDRLASGWKAWLILLAITMGAAAPGVFQLPALDRDESRFAQASKQMLETGDYIRIRYQDELRNKKPAGIHWLQAGSTALFSSAEAKQIWSYRVPSWIGAGLGTLACFWTGLVLVGRRAAFLGSALFGACLLLTSEAHISKTDGVLIFLTTLAIGALARLYMRADQDKSLALLFWFAMGAGFLIKGPVTPLVAGFAGLGVWVWARAAEARGGDWWRVLVWWPGPLIFVALVLPWFIWIQVATGGQYIEGAVGKDLKDKFVGASEGHGGWPLYHLSHFPIWFFPATLLAIPGGVIAWQGLRGAGELARRRGSDALVISAALIGLTGFIAWIFGPQLLVAYPFLLLGSFLVLGLQRGWHQRWPQTGTHAPDDAQRAMRFLLAWGLLNLFFFELMPTRLSHYIMPAYPAYALIAGHAGVRLVAGARMPVSWGLSLVLFALGGAVLALASYPGIDELVMAEAAGDFRTAPPGAVMAAWRGDLDYPLWLWWSGVLLLVGGVLAGVRRAVIPAAVLGVLAATALGWHIRSHFLPAQIWIQPSEQARLALAQVCALPDLRMNGAGCLDGPARVQAVGYSEPSYVMTLGTQNLHPPQTTVALPGSDDALPAGFLINLEDRAGEPALQQIITEAQARGLCVRRSAPHFALNYSNGDPAHFIGLRIDGPPCR